MDKRGRPILGPRFNPVPCPRCGADAGRCRRHGPWVWRPHHFAWGRG